MWNLVLFLASSGLISITAWLFSRWGQTALTAWIALVSLLANLFVLKQISFLQFNATASDVYAIGGLVGLNLLQEKYGKAAAQQAIWISFGCLLTFMIMAQIHLFYIPSIHDHSQAAYQPILAPSARIFIASLLVFLLAQHCDRQLYHWFRQNFPRASVVGISTITVVLSQALDTVLFSFLGLYGIVTAIGEIILVSFAIKCCAIAAVTPWSWITRHFENAYAR